MDLSTLARWLAYAFGGVWFAFLAFIVVSASIGSLRNGIRRLRHWGKPRFTVHDSIVKAAFRQEGREVAIMEAAGFPMWTPKEPEDPAP